MRKAYTALKILGFRGLARAFYRRFVPERMAYMPRCAELLQSRIGLELGGPSAVFSDRGILPIYPIAARIDNCNFGTETVWEGHVHAGDTFVFNQNIQPGRQYIAEASALPFIGDSEYDFVLSSHCLEHLANPLKGLKEWIRILKEDGLLILLLPHKDGTFDHRRPVTSLAHIMEDFEAGTPETDLTHLAEILKLHDLDRDPDAGNLESFTARSRRNFENRCLHHHVFDARLAVEVVNQAGLQILAVQMFRPYHIAVVAQKMRNQQKPDNARFRDHQSSPPWSSPFPSDRIASG